MKEKVTTVAKE